VHQHEIIKFDLKYEYAREGSCKLIKSHAQLMIKANTPGCGKSHSCEGMFDLGYNVVFSCRTNKFVRHYDAANDKRTSITIHDFFHIRVGEESITAFDCSDYNVFIVGAI
jgi:hypothetical protein